MVQSAGQRWGWADGQSCASRGLGHHTGERAFAAQGAAAGWDADGLHMRECKQLQIGTRFSLTGERERL